MGLGDIQVVRVFRWVDPYLGGEVVGLGLLSLKAVWVGRKGLIEGGLASGMDSLCRAVVDAVRGHVADAGVLVLVVVPAEELLTESACIGQATEACGEVGAVLQGLELGLAKRVVVGHVGAAVTLGLIQPAATGKPQRLQGSTCGTCPQRLLRPRRRLWSNRIGGSCEI